MQRCKRMLCESRNMSGSNACFSIHCRRRRTASSLHFLLRFAGSAQASTTRVYGCSGGRWHRKGHLVIACDTLHTPHTRILDRTAAPSAVASGKLVSFLARQPQSALTATSRTQLEGNQPDVLLAGNGLSSAMTCPGGVAAAASSEANEVINSFTTPLITATATDTATHYTFCHSHRHSHTLYFLPQPQSHTNYCHRRYTLASTAQHSTAHHSTAQCSTDRPRLCSRLTPTFDLIQSSLFNGNKLAFAQCQFVRRVFGCFKVLDHLRLGHFPLLIRKVVFFRWVENFQPAF